MEVLVVTDLWEVRVSLDGVEEFRVWVAGPFPSKVQEAVVERFGRHAEIVKIDALGTGELLGVRND